MNVSCHARSPVLTIAEDVAPRVNVCLNTTVPPAVKSMQERTHTPRTMMKTFLPFVFPIFLLSMVLSLSIPVRAQALRTPDRPVASIQEFGPEVSLEVTFNRPVRYVTHPDGGLTVQHTPGLEVTGISTATADRGGAMWNPGQGEQGYGRWQPQGFDSFMRNKGGRNTYDASLNVSPAATGSPFPVPGEGSLVIAIPRQTTKANRVVRLYRVMNFAEHLPPEGTYRAPARGMILSIPA